jgi:hypothetical protein
VTSSTLGGATSCSVRSPLADGTEADQALLLVAAERAAGADCWRVVGLLLLGSVVVVVVVVVLGPPTLCASSPPSTVFEPEADHPLLLGRLTLGDALSPSSHNPPWAQPSVPAALS